MFETIIFFTLNLLLLIGDVAPGFNENLNRNKRYLVNPNAGPSRAQFIFGLGVPVDLQEQSLTIGSVIKMQYLVPINSSEYTTRIYGFSNTVSRDMNEASGTNPDEDTVDKIEIEFNETTENDSIVNYSTDLNDENETLVDINFDNNDTDRKRRSLLYTEGGVLNNNIEKDEEITLEEAIQRQELIDKNSEEVEEPQRLNRWDFYRILENTAGKYGYTGRPCLLRTICEAAEVSFTYQNGLFGEIGHILFTPSTSTDDLSHHSDNEYHAAEKLGRQEDVDCESLFPECEGSILEMFTQIGMDTLHKFGL